MEIDYDFGHALRCKQASHLHNRVIRQNKMLHHFPTTNLYYEPYFHQYEEIDDSQALDLILYVHQLVHVKQEMQIQPILQMQHSQ